MTTPTPAAIAATLSWQMREAVLDSTITSRGRLLWHEDGRTMRALWKRGICTRPDYKGTAFETDIGAAVRAHLEKNDG